MKRFVFVLMVVISFFSLRAQVMPDQKKGEVEDETLVGKPPIQASMRGVLSSMVRLMPYIGSKEKFTAKENEALILSELASINLAFGQVHQSDVIKTPSFLPSLGLVKRHIAETINAFNSPNRYFAAGMIKATAQICVSCHMALPEGKQFDVQKSFAELGTKSSDDSLERGEFLFLIRKFDEAASAYRGAIDQILRSKKMGGSQDQIKVGDAFRKIVVIYTLPQLKPMKAHDILKQFMEHDRISKFQRQELKSWMADLVRLEATSKKWKMPDNDKMMEQFIHRNLQNKEADEFDLSYLASVGVLKRYVFEMPETKLVPEFYYYFSKAERMMGRELYFSLADVYLKDCMERYHKEPFAKSCFREYEDQLTMGYTGSSGTHIPADERRKLEDYRKLIFGN